jgi:hypothetical protein
MSVFVVFFCSVAEERTERIKRYDATMGINFEEQKKPFQNPVDSCNPATRGSWTPWKYDSVIVLVYRVNLSDHKISESLQYMDSVNAVCNRMYKEWSNGKFKVVWKMFPRIWTAPKDSAFYATDRNDLVFKAFYQQMIKDSAGVDPAKPGPTTRIMVYHPSISYNSSGGPPLMAINNGYFAWRNMHELHHTMGTHHSNGLECGTKIISGLELPTEQLEYGDLYCNEGIGYEKDLNCIFKDYFGWLNSEEMKTVTGKKISIALPKGIASGSVCIASVKGAGISRAARIVVQY